MFFLNKKIYTLLRVESIFVEISVAQRPRQAVGKDPGGVVVSKCVQVSKGLWYPGGIFVVSNWYLLLLSQPSNHHYSVNGHLEANDP